MKQTIAITLCKVLGHPGLRQRARLMADSGYRSAMLFWRCPRCSVEVRSIEIDAASPRHCHQRAAAFE